MSEMSDKQSGSLTAGNGSQATIPISAPPKDHLDLTLAASYDQHAVWGADRAHVVKQEHQGLVGQYEDENSKDGYV